MKIQELNRIRKLYFGHEEISRVLGISLQSSRVSANRYVKHGLLIRIKRNMYVLTEKWRTLEREEKFILANLLQVPSYISLMTALDYYEISTQMQRDFIESVALKRTKEIEAENSIFTYTKINTNLYKGFKKEEGFFIAVPEKAFLDAFYLMSLGRYSFDIASIDFNKLNRDETFRLIKMFPARIQKVMDNNGYF